MLYNNSACYLLSERITDNYYIFCIKSRDYTTTTKIKGQDEAGLNEGRCYT